MLMFWLNEKAKKKFFETRMAENSWAETGNLNVRRRRAIYLVICLRVRGYYSISLNSVVNIIIYEGAELLN